MYCSVCGSNMIISATHFEKEKNPKRYYECKKCHTKFKDTIVSFEEVLKRVQKPLDAE